MCIHSVQVSAWGGYVFIINLVPLHVFLLLIMGRFSNRYVHTCTCMYIIMYVYVRVYLCVHQDMSVHVLAGTLYMDTCVYHAHVHVHVHISSAMWM